MSVSPSYRTFIVEQLGRVRTGIRDKPMFGGVGIYADDLFFALLDNDTIYLKVNDGNRGDFEARGMGPFRPAGEHGETMQYYQLPEEVLEDMEELGRWVEKAVAAAHAAKRRKKRQA